MRVVGGTPERGRYAGDWRPSPAPPGYTDGDYDDAAPRTDHDNDAALARILAHVVSRRDFTGGP